MELTFTDLIISFLGLWLLFDLWFSSLILKEAGNTQSVLSFSWRDRLNLSHFFNDYKLMMEKIKHHFTRMLPRTRRLKFYEDRIAFLTKRNMFLKRQQLELNTLILEMENDNLKRLNKARNEEVMNLKSGFIHELNTALTLVANSVGPLKNDIEELSRKSKFQDSNTLITEVNELINAIDSGAERARKSSQDFSKILPDPRFQNLYDRELNEFLVYKKAWYQTSFPEVHFNLHLGKETNIKCEKHTLIVIDNLLAIATEKVREEEGKGLIVSISEHKEMLVFILQFDGVYPVNGPKKKEDKNLLRSRDLVKSLSENHELGLEVKSDMDGPGTSCVSFKIPLSEKSKNNILENKNEKSPQVA